MLALTATGVLARISLSRSWRLVTLGLSDCHDLDNMAYDLVIFLGGVLVTKAPVGVHGLKPIILE